MACRRPRGTNGRPPPATRPQPHPPPHSTRHRRSPPRIAAVPHALPRAVDQASASVLALRDRPVAASVLPSQLLVVKALRRPVESAQYTSIAFGQRCRDMDVRPSMGSVGDAYDNALCESFFATLECDLLARPRFQTQAEAGMAIFEFIGGWYTPPRRHSALD